MESTQKNLKKATELTKNLVSAQVKPLLFIFALGALLTLQLEGLIADLPKTEESSRWMLQLTMGIWELFEGIMVFLILSWGIPKVHPAHAAQIESQPFQSPYLGSFLAEYLRQIAQTLLFGLMLLIPGVIRYCQLIFVPYIALFSKLYRQDQADAIAFSRQLTRPYFWVILGAFFFTTVLQVGLEFLPQVVVALHEWPVRVGLMALSLLIAVWTFSFIFVLFEEALAAYTEPVPS